MGNVELVIVHFDAHFHFRIFQIDPTGLGGLHQRAADQSLQVNRTEIMLAMAPCTHRKGFAFQSTSKGLYSLGAHVVQVHKRVNRDFLDGGNAGNAGQFINHRAGQAPAFGHVHIYPVPAAIHPDVGIQASQEFPDILPQLAHLLLANGFAFDGHFSGRTNQ